MRARHPDQQDYLDIDGVRIGYEVFGDGSPTVLAMPTWNIIHTCFWKMQIPYLARHYKVVTFDGPGNGRSARPLDPAAYDMDVLVAAAIEVLDVTKTDKAVVISLSQAAAWSLQLTVSAPERVLGQVFIGPGLPLTPPLPERASIRENFNKVIENPQGWEKYTAHHWLSNYRDFLEFFFSQCFSELHSTKQREDSVGWGVETSPEVLLAEARSNFGFEDRDTVLAACRQVAAPSLVIQGDQDRITTPARGQALAEATGGLLLTLEGSGHIPLARDPVKVNLAIKDFIERVKA